MDYKKKLSREDIAELPLMRYEGPLTLVRDSDALDVMLKELEGERLIGFDTETRAAFRKGEVYQPSLIQLASATMVYLVQLRHIPLDGRLTALLADRNVIKTGVAVGRDVRELRELHEFEAAGFVDLGTTAEKSGMKHHGLRGLAALLLDVRISKSAQRTNWAKRELTDRQQAYAAADAKLGRDLYLVMQDLDLELLPDKGLRL